MMISVNEYSGFLNKLAKDIDIPPRKYEDAVDRYQDVGKWLEGGIYPGAYSDGVDISPQGSFRLGTVTRPVRSGMDSDYDIDLVCEIPLRKDQTDPLSVKKMVGDRLKENESYRKMLEEEGKRCWTLAYSEEDYIGFHLDVLPAVPDPQMDCDTAIAITNKRDSSYAWSASDPKGYARWFDERNRAAFDSIAAEQKRLVQQSAPMVYARVEDVPDRLVRTSLQRAIQIMKRHRDIYCADPKYAPISIIITTLAACFYQGEPNLYSALKNIVDRLTAYKVLFDHPASGFSGLIKRTTDGGWHISNPVNPDENFADRWHEDDHARARMFFSWLVSLRRDLIDILAQDRSMVEKTVAATLGVRPVATKVHGKPRPWRKS